MTRLNGSHMVETLHESHLGSRPQSVLFLLSPLPLQAVKLANFTFLYVVQCLP